MPQSTDNASRTRPQENDASNGHAPHQASDTQPQALQAPKVLREPPTGEEFLEGLRDGRVIYFDGELVKDVTTHPAFATSARSYARMYDTLHDPDKHAVLSCLELIGLN